MKLARVLLAVCAGLIASIVLAELALRELPVTMGLYRTRSHDAWPLQAYGQHQHFSYSMTWQMLHPNRGSTNNYGQVAPFDYVPASKPVVVIGDSFVEALMNRYDDTLQGELGRLLAPRVPVYGLGFSGNSLAEYLAVARMAKAEFSPVGMVFLIIDNDIKESWTNRSGHRYFAIDGATVREGYLPLDTVGTAQRIRQAIGDSALYRYVQVNLGFSLEGVLARRAPSGREVSPQASPEAEDRSRRAVDYFLDTLPRAAGIAPERLVLVFDADRERIYDPLRPARQGVDSMEMQSYLKDRARALGYAIIDTGPLFADHYRAHHRRFDYTPVDRHWNGLAHRLVAAESCRRLVAGGDSPDSAIRADCAAPIAAGPGVGEQK